MDLTINRGVWSKYTDDELKSFEDEVYEHYRSTGFPYLPTDYAYRESELERFLSFDHMRLLDGNTIRQSMHGLSFCWSYMPHAFSVNCNGLRSPLETFNNDELFRDVIRKRLRFGDTVTPNGIRKMLKIYTGTQCVSNFRPTSAAVIYELFGKGKCVWDMSCGYGGRMLGAMKAKVGKYIGTEPCDETYDGLVSMLDDFPRFRKHTEYELHKCGSECFHPAANSLDLCFTSPPYFDTEKYSNDISQSYVKYATRESWIGGFMKDTLTNCFYGLKSDGVLAINIANVKSYPNIEDDIIKCAVEIGFHYSLKMNYALSSISAKQSFKYEPIFLFTKRGTELTIRNDVKSLF